MSFILVLRERERERELFPLSRASFSEEGDDDVGSLRGRQIFRGREVERARQDNLRGRENLNFSWEPLEGNG